MQKQTIEKKKRKRIIQNWVRRFIQLVFFIFLPSLFSEAFAGVKNVFVAVGQWKCLEYQTFTQTFVILSVITIVFGRYFCGYACAFGSLGDFIYGIRKFMEKKAKKRFPTIPETVSLKMQKAKYINLLVVLSVCVIGFEKKLGNNSPWETFSKLRIGNVDLVATGWLGVIFLGIIIIGMFCKERFFCQYLCPLGAIFSLLPILPTGTLNRKRNECIKGCGVCKKQCPVHHQPEGISLHSNECIQCGKCRMLCPKGNIGIIIKNKMFSQKDCIKELPGEHYKRKEFLQ